MKEDLKEEKKRLEFLAHRKRITDVSDQLKTVRSLNRTNFWILT